MTLFAVRINLITSSGVLTRFNLFRMIVAFLSWRTAAAIAATAEAAVATVAFSATGADLYSSATGSASVAAGELRGNGHIVAVCGATGLAASAFARGMTVHKRFIIPVIEEDNQNQPRPPLRSGLHPNSGQAALLRESSLLIIDEVWALSSKILHAVNDKLKEIMHSNESFGGLIVVAVGDPRQTAPVTKENTEQSSLESYFLSSPLFPQFIITELEAAQRQAGDAQLSAWVDHIGDDYHQHPIDMSLYFAQATSLQDAMNFLFPPNVLSDPRRVVSRCFLTPLNVNVDEFNDMVSEHLPGVEHVKYSYDSLKDVERTDANAADIDAALATLSHLTHPRIPDH
ncbi:hypothetical protein CF326_g4535 [Tilletia indica]|nr:hypothetical protein CF326_g4535 [Tilletia indica]